MLYWVKCAECSKWPALQQKHAMWPNFLLFVYIEVLIAYSTNILEVRLVKWPTTCNQMQSWLLMGIIQPVSLLKWSWSGHIGGSSVGMENSPQFTIGFLPSMALQLWIEANKQSWEIEALNKKKPWKTNAPQKKKHEFLWWRLILYESSLQTLIFLNWMIVDTQAPDTFCLKPRSIYRQITSVST